MVRKDDPAQAEADKLRSTARWQALRLDVLKDEPWCRECRKECEALAQHGNFGAMDPAVEVDHVVPAVDLIRAGTPEKVFDKENLQPLCKRHHTKKSAAEARRRTDGDQA